MAIRTYTAEDSVLGASQTPEIRVAVPDESQVGRSIQQLGRQALGVIEAYQRKKKVEEEEDQNPKFAKFQAGWVSDEGHTDAEDAKVPATTGTVDKMLTDSKERTERGIVEYGLTGRTAEKARTWATIRAASKIEPLSRQEQEARLNESIGSITANLAEAKVALGQNPSAINDWRTLIYETIGQARSDGWITDDTKADRLERDAERALVASAMDGLLLTDPQKAIDATIPPKADDPNGQDVDHPFQQLGRFLEADERFNYQRKAAAILDDKSAVNGAQVRARHTAIVQQLEAGEADKMEVEAHRKVLEGMGAGGAVMLDQLKAATIGAVVKGEAAKGTIESTKPVVERVKVPAVISKKGLPGGEMPTEPDAKLFPKTDAEE